MKYIIRDKDIPELIDLVKSKPTNIVMLQDEEKDYTLHCPFCYESVEPLTSCGLTECESCKQKLLLKEKSYD